MCPTMPPPAPRPQVGRLDGVRPVMAKVLKKIEHPWRERIGLSIVRAFELAGVSQKEAAALLDRDPAQIARWCAGSERPAFDVIFSVPQLRSAFVISLAELSDEVEIATTITVRRVA